MGSSHWEPIGSELVLVSKIRAIPFKNWKGRQEILNFTLNMLNTDIMIQN